MLLLTAQVYVGDEYCGTVKYKAGQLIYSVECNKAVGGYVTIKQPHNHLTLCEVKVYGEKSDRSKCYNKISKI